MKSTLVLLSSTPTCTPERTLLARVMRRELRAMAYSISNMALKAWHLEGSSSDRIDWQEEQEGEG